MAGVFKMVEEAKKLHQISDRIDELSKPREEIGERRKRHEENVVLFFSFDIANSTAYKTVNYYGWAQVLNLLFKELREEVQRQIDGSEMWRVLGDEAIFIVKIRNENVLCEYINKIFKIMISTIYKLKKGAFFKFDDEFDMLKLQNILSLKTTAWVAAVTNVGDISDGNTLYKNAVNIFERYKSQDGNEIFEFLGNDIDTGFRLSKQTQDGRMVLSYELAYLISQKTESLSHLHIITYRKLKGIWGDRLYPVIWYHDPKTYLEFYDKELPLQDSFTFDACDESDLIKEYYDNRKADRKEEVIRDGRMYKEPYYALNKILLDRGLEEKVKHLQHLIQDTTHDPTRYINTELMELHCVAVCFQEDENGTKILVAKRQRTREKHRGEWEFGCAKAVIDKSIAQKIKEEYRQDFGIEVEPVLDEARDIKEPVPLALYQAVHDPQNSEPEKQDKGIITLARIVQEFDLKNFEPTRKHEKVAWITETDLPDIEKRFEKRVPDFEQSLKEAFKKIKELSKEKKQDDAAG